MTLEVCGQRHWHEHCVFSKCATWALVNTKLVQATPNQTDPEGLKGSDLAVFHRVDERMISWSGGMRATDWLGALGAAVTA